jgi:hypothetical protein
MNDCSEPLFDQPAMVNRHGVWEKEVGASVSTSIQALQYGTKGYKLSDDFVRDIRFRVK